MNHRTNFFHMSTTVTRALWPLHLVALRAVAGVPCLPPVQVTA
jgi:hypothetical protein